MRFSRTLKSSEHSIPSPNGECVATLFPSKLTFRSTRSLELLRSVTVPAEVSSNIQWFFWSPTSNRVLLSGNDCICVYSATEDKFTAKITNPTASTAKITHITFGISDDDLLVFSDFGLKLTLFNLLTSKSIEINSPKFYSPANCAKGYGYRPKTGSLALLARSGGKDIVSIHAGSTREAIRSWYPETVDAQALYWSPDGKWQAVLESAGQGHKILFYTADGHLYKAWNGPTPICAEDEHISLGAGVRIVQWAPKGDYFAVSDYGPQVMLLSAPTFVSKLNLCHKSTIQPITGLHIWQEQVMALPDNKFERGFTMCNATICPPVATASPVRADSTQTGGTNILSFDHSGTLLATRSESMPTTIWIWDLASKGLRAVLILHAPIARVAWHPSINEILLIRCEGEDSKGLVHLWEPSWETPKILDFGTQLPEGKILGKAVARWLNVNSATPCVFFSDTQDCILASLAESDEDDVPWQESTARGVDIYGQREESPLDLVPANETRMFSKALQEPTITAMSGFSDEVDDTFQFKKFVE